MGWKMVIKNKKDILVFYTVYLLWGTGLFLPNIVYRRWLQVYLETSITLEKSVKID